MSSSTKPSASHSWRDLAVALAVMLGASAWPLRDASGRAVGEGVDLYGSLWFHAWMDHCVRTLTWPGWTDWFFHPTGKDIFADTGANLVDAVLAVPFFALFGTPDHMAPFAAVLLVGNGLAMWAMLRAMGVRQVGALAGGVVFVLSPATLSELDGGRMTQALQWFWPLALRELWLDRDDPRTARLVRAGVLVALQAWTYWFAGHFFALVFALPLLCVVRPKRLVGAGLFAVLAVAPAVVPMVWLMSTGDAPTGEGLVRISTGQLDPDAWWVLAPAWSQLHVPAIVLVCMGLGLLGSQRRLLWGLSGGFGLLLVAGARLHFFDFSVPNPLWTVGTWLPGFERLLFPARGWCALSLVGAAAVGEAVDRGARWSPVLLVATVIAMLVGRDEAVQTTAVEVPQWTQAVRDNPGPVLNLPVPCGQYTIHYQPLHGQPMLGGMAEHIAPLVPDAVHAQWRSEELAPLVQAALGRGGGPQSRGLPKVTSARWVVLHLDLLTAPLALGTCLRGTRPQPKAARRELEKLLGPPTVTEPHTLAWDLSRSGS